MFSYCQFAAAAFLTFVATISYAGTLPTLDPPFAATNSTPVTTGYSITINPDINWGTWDGWGVSLCWWANVFGERDDLADVFFTTNLVNVNGSLLPGLGLNIVRYNAGACSSNSIGGAVMQASAKIPAHRQVEGFWQDGRSNDPDSPSWNWSADAKQRAMLLKAKARGANFLELFSNSPMWWMCLNHNPSGANAGALDNLQPQSQDQHPIYLATLAKYAKDHWDIDFDSVEPFNEPSANWWTATNNQEGCHFAPDTQATVINYLRRELDNRGLNSVNVAASDENTYDAALNTLNHFSSATCAQINQVNTHGYQFSRGQRDLLYRQAAGKRLWNSEYGDNDASGLKLAKNLDLDFHHLHPSGWCYWQALDGGGWGLISANLARGQIGATNPKFFVLAQYTRHIRPGMTILDCSDENTVAAYDPKMKKLVLVTANYEMPQWIKYNLANFSIVGSSAKLWITCPEANVSYQSVTNNKTDQSTFRFWFPANSIQTIEIQNTCPAPATIPK